ncbi:MAG: MogA/MoaB family molybdenum cofactor biosynthesis protein [Bryobacteraceae bacterium]
MIRVAIVTISDGVSAGTREDKSGAALAMRIGELGWKVEETHVIPDGAEGIATMFTALEASGGIEVIVSTGGTGVGPRDVTPEAVRSIADRDIPGFGELMRAEGLKKTKFAPLSRSAAYTRGKTLILTLPGSPRGAVESLDAVAYLVGHVVDLLHGRTEHHANFAAENKTQSE